MRALPDHIPDPLRAIANARGDAPAIIDQGTGRTWSFNEFDHYTDELAAMMIATGAEPGARIALRGHNSAPQLAALLAAIRAGMIGVPLNWRLTPTETALLLGQIDPTLILADEPDADALDGFHARAQHFPPPSATAPSSERPPISLPADRPGYLLFTSGSSGKPKAVINTSRMVVANAMAVAGHLNLTPEDRGLSFLPMFHAAGIGLYTLPVLFAGGTVTLHPQFDAGDTLRALASGAATVMFGVPTVYELLSSHDNFSSTDFRAVRQWGCGGAPLPVSTATRWERRGVRLCPGYGMTETGPFAFITEQHEAAADHRTIGKMRGNAACRIMMEDGAIAEPGKVGEIQFSGDSITPGYWRDDDATKSAFTPDGWLKSGDLGRQDTDGLTYIVGRMSDMFISGGENVHPAEVEAVLRAHPAIAEVAVVGVPDHKWGEAGCAFVVPAHAGAVDEDQIRNFARTSLTSFKIPRDIHITDDLPRTATGKIARAELQPLKQTIEGAICPARRHA